MIRSLHFVTAVGASNLPLVIGVVVPVILTLATIIAIIVIAYIIMKHKCKFTLLMYVAITIHTVILFIDRYSQKE